MEFRDCTLSNGLEIVAECNPAARSQALGFFVETGARDETAEVAGVSHFLEHMAFKGTPTRTADDVNRQFDEIGAHYNAFTTEEQTVYYASVLPEYQQQALELLGDIMRPSLREDDFNTEKQVIIEEICMYQDQPPFGADDRCRALHFDRHPLGRSVLGTVESIGDLSVEAMRAYFQRRYSPGNIVLAATGRIDFDELVAGAEQFCGSWEAAPAGRHSQPDVSKPSFHCLQKEGATHEYLIQLARGPAAGDPQRYAAKLLATVLGDDCGSRLYWALVDSGLAEYANLGHHEYQDTGIFVTHMSCEPQFVADNLQQILDIYRKAECEGVTESELGKAKNKINARVVLSSERPRGRLFNLGANWTQRHEYRSVKDDLDAVEAITVDDLATVLADYPLSQGTTVVIGPADQVATPR